MRRAWIFCVKIQYFFWSGWDLNRGGRVAREWVGGSERPCTRADHFTCHVFKEKFPLNLQHTHTQSDNLNLAHNLAGVTYLLSHSCVCDATRNQLSMTYIHGIWIVKVSVEIWQFLRQGSYVVMWHGANGVARNLVGCTWLPWTTWMFFPFLEPFWKLDLWSHLENTCGEDKSKSLWKVIKKLVIGQTLSQSEEETGWWSNTFKDHILLPLSHKTSSPNSY